MTASGYTSTGSGTYSPPIPQSDVTGLVSGLAAKAADSAVVHNTGGETVAGLKVFTDGAEFGTGGARVVIDDLSDTQGVWIDATLSSATNPTVSVKLRGKGPSGAVETYSVLNATAGLAVTGTATVGGANIATATDLALKADAAAVTVALALKADAAATTTALAGKTPTTRALTAGTGLTGGGDLSSDRSFAVSTTATVPSVPVSAGSAGVATTFSRSDHQHPGNGWSAADHGLIAWNFPNYVGGASQILSLAGTLTVWKVPMSITTNITNVILAVGSVGVTLTTSQCYAGLWLADGTFKGLTADQSVAWVSAGVKVMTLGGGPYSNGGQDVYVGAWYNGSTSPGFVRAGSAPSGLANVGLASSATYKYATANTGLTDSTSGSVSLGTRSASNNMIWAAVS